MGKMIALFSQIQTNYQGHIVPGIITRVYDEQPDDADEAVDVHLYVPTDLNVPGNIAALKGLRHAENKANPKAHPFIFYGEDQELLQPKPVEPPPVEAEPEPDGNAGEGAPPETPAPTKTKEQLKKERKANK